MDGNVARRGRDGRVRRTGRDYAVAKLGDGVALHRVVFAGRPDGDELLRGSFWAAHSLMDKRVARVGCAPRVGSRRARPAQLEFAWCWALNFEFERTASTCSALSVGFDCAKLCVGREEMQALAQSYITEDEFWELEKVALLKHEYFDGYIYAMSGGSNRHSTIGTNAAATLVAKLRGRSCRALNSDQAVKIESNGLITYPDVSVHCQPARFEGSGDRALLNPIVLIEVLSPLTSEYDRGQKFRHYRQIESLRDYLLVEQNVLQVDYFHRLDDGQWLMRTFAARDDEIRLESIDCTLALRDLYDGVEFPDGPQLLRAPHEEI